MTASKNDFKRFMNRNNVVRYFRSIIFHVTVEYCFLCPSTFGVDFALVVFSNFSSWKYGIAHGTVLFID
jgi:hypothetical protein